MLMHSAHAVWAIKEHHMQAIRSRAVVSFLVTIGLGLLFWLRPGLSLQQLGIVTAEGGMFFTAGIAFIGLLYLVVQGYPLGYASIGTSGMHTVDSIISLLPGIPALFGIVTTLTNLWTLSTVNLVLACFVLALVVYDAWILGGAANKVLHLTDEMQTIK